MSEQAELCTLHNADYRESYCVWCKIAELEAEREGMVLVPEDIAEQREIPHPMEEALHQSYLSDLRAKSSEITQLNTRIAELEAERDRLKGYLEDQIFANSNIKGRLAAMEKERDAAIAGLKIAAGGDQGTGEAG